MLGAYSTLSLAAVLPVLPFGLSSAMEPSERKRRSRDCHSSCESAHLPGHGGPARRERRPVTRAHPRTDPGVLLVVLGGTQHNVEVQLKRGIRSVDELLRGRSREGSHR